MSPQQLTLARRRLWLGISNVGFWVIAAGSGLYWLTTAGKTTLDLRALATIGLVVVALQGVFDFIGGGVFCLLEALRGWCVARACGVKTR